MRITLIRYEETFPTGIEYKNIRLTAEATIDGDIESLPECYKILRTEVHESFKQMHPRINVNQTQPSNPESIGVIDRGKKELLEFIADSETLAEVELFRGKAIHYGVEDVLDKKRIEIITKTMQS